jgi:superfamily II DNA helicase RecQ
MIDYAQESGRGGRAGELADSVIVVEQGEVERAMQQKGDDLDVQAMGMFLVGSGCRRGLMSSYLDGKRVECNDIDLAGCDRCGEGSSEWYAAQARASREWEQVQAVMDELRHGCALCWVLQQRGEEEDEEEDGRSRVWQEHKTIVCSEWVGLTGADMDKFRRDGKGTHSCRRCWVSQKYCATGEDIRNRH